MKRSETNPRRGGADNLPLHYHMKKIYHQLTREQRYKLESYLEAGKNQSQILLLLGFHRSTISREIARNVAKRGVGAKVYNADNAQKNTDIRHHLKQKHTKFCLPLKEQMLEWMNVKKYSPDGKNSDVITQKIIDRLKIFPTIKTMTFDNDQAFSQHEKIAKALKIKTYFTRPYTSQDKGTIENRNGVIGLFFPKKTDFNLIDEIEVKRVENEINNRPIRKFGYLSANQVFLRKKVRVALIT